MGVTTTKKRQTTPVTFNKTGFNPYAVNGNGGISGGSQMAMTNSTTPAVQPAPPSPLMSMMQIPVIHCGIIIGLVVVAFMVVHHLAKAATD